MRNLTPCKLEALTSAMKDDDDDDDTAEEAGTVWGGSVCHLFPSLVGGTGKLFLNFCTPWES